MTSRRTLLYVLACAGLPLAAMAQDVDIEAEFEADIGAQAPAEVIEQMEVPPPEPAKPPPGEEVMRPTEHGFRFTRPVSDAIIKQMVGDMKREITLSDEQSQRLTEALQDRVWGMQERSGAEAARAVECFYETIMQLEVVNRDQEERITPEEARRIGQTMRPGVQLIEEFWEGVFETAEPILDPSQLEALRAENEDDLQGVRRFREKMERWSQGDVHANEGILDGLDDDEEESEGEGDGKSQRRRQAEQSAQWELQQLGPEFWRQFLRQAGQVLEFSADQTAEGERLLDEYKAKAEAIMTEEWKREFTAIKVQQQLQYEAGDQHLAPWLYRLEVRMRELSEPLRKLGRSFRQKVIALGTTEQRERLLIDLREAGLKHGMPAEELEASLLFAALIAPKPDAMPTETP